MPAPPPTPPPDPPAAPHVPAAGAAPAPAAPPAVVEPPFRVLVAEDDDALREVVLAVLERFAGVLELLEACHGREAVRIIRGERVDVAVLDYRMPHGSGLDALCELGEGNPAAPGILVSADADGRLREEPAAALAHRVLAKPVGRRALVAAVDSALRTAYDAALPKAA